MSRLDRLRRRLIHVLWPDNGTGAPEGWNWILSLYVKRGQCLDRLADAAFLSLFAAGTLTGFDAAGHIAEETKNAR